MINLINAIIVLLGFLSLPGIPVFWAWYVDRENRLK
jgi:hypothetical protein